MAARLTVFLFGVLIVAMATGGTLVGLLFTVLTWGPACAFTSTAAPQRGRRR